MVMCYVLYSTHVLCVPQQLGRFTCVYSDVHLSLAISQSYQEKTWIIALALSLEFLKSIPFEFQHNLIITKSFLRSHCPCR